MDTSSASLSSSLPSLPSSLPSKRIAVLGAGPMGLAVAYQLAVDGYTPIVFEADDRIGGMAAAFDFSGTTIERYYHFHCTSDQAFIDLLGELGLSDQLHWRPAKMGFWFNNQLQAWGNPLALIKLKGLGLPAKIRYGVHAFVSVRRNDWLPLDQQDAVTWVKKWVGPKAYEALWRRLFEYKFYDYCNNLSAAWIWSRVRRLGRSRYNVMQEKLGYLEGGSQTLLNAMQQTIQAHGGEIRLSTPIEHVRITNGQVQGVEWGGAQFEPFDKVISTIPLPYVPRIMPDLPAAILAQFAAKKNIAVVCVIAKLRKALTEYFWLNTNDPAMDIPGLVEYTNLYPLGKEHIAYVPFYLPGEHPKFLESDAIFKDKVKSYFQQINPSLLDTDFIDMRVSRYRYAQPICEPGYLKTLPPVKLPIAGLWVADTSYYYPEDRGISESVDFGRKMAKEAISN
jgi:protoporphyrinogen oxidase